jgi:hypothetical protein
VSVAVLLNGSELVISEAAVSAILLVMTGPGDDRSHVQIDLAVRNTRVLARHSLRAIRAGESPAQLRDAVSDLAGSVWALGAPVRSTAVDLMRAAELVAGEPERLATEELLLGRVRAGSLVEETPWILTLAEPEAALA